MDLYDINRVALILRPSTKLLSWAISEDPSLAADIDPEETDDLSSVFLLPDFDEMDAAEEWLEANFQSILESLLEEWIPNETAWPEPLSFEHLDQFSDYAFTNIVIDTQDQSYDDEY